MAPVGDYGTEFLMNVNLEVLMKREIPDRTGCRQYSWLWWNAVRHSITFSTLVSVCGLLEVQLFAVDPEAKRHQPFQPKVVPFRWKIMIVQGQSVVKPCLLQRFFDRYWICPQLHDTNLSHFYDHNLEKALSKNCAEWFHTIQIPNSCLSLLILEIKKKMLN